MSLIHGQPDNPGAHCPCCGQRWPDTDADVEGFLRRNAGRFTAADLARFVSWPLARLQRLAQRASPPIDLTYRAVEREPEPRGA